MLGERIATLRKEKNISQEELADVMMTSRQAISKWERGESEPDINHLKDLAIYFGVSVDYLLGYDLGSVSLNGFIKRLDKAIENKTHDISLDEIKMVISRNKNNFNLYLKAGTYLEYFFIQTKEIEIVDYLIELYKMIIPIYQPNSLNTLNDYHKGIAALYTMKQRYDLAKQYIEENHIYDAEDLIAECNLELGNYDAALESISSTFLKAVSLMIDSNAVQIRLLLKTNRVSEACDLANWSINFIRSIGKNEDMLKDVIFALMALKALCEKYLKLDYSESFNFLKDNYGKVSNIQTDTGSMRFYMGKKETLFTMFFNFDEMMRSEIEGLKKNKELYDSSLELFQELTGEK